MTAAAKSAAKRKRAQSESADGLNVLLVTGMSGAGKTTALKALEDLGYEAVDNLPLSLLGNLVRSVDRFPRPLAIGIDIRTRDFGVELLSREIDTLRADGGVEVALMFLDCDDEVLGRRFTETRRRHPLAEDRPVSDGIRHERLLVSPLRDRADYVLDTSALAPGELRQQLRGRFDAKAESGMALFVTSFAYRNGVPRDADLVFDVRFLANPHYDPALQQLSGLDSGVQNFIAADPGYQPFFDSLTALIEPLLPRYESKGKSYLTIAVGCTGGRHRSVFIAEALAGWLREQGRPVSPFHRDVDTVDEVDRK